MSTAVERLVAIVPPFYFAPVGHGRISPLANSNAHPDCDSLPDDQSQLSIQNLESVQRTATDQQTAITTVLTTSRPNAPALCRRSSSSSDEESSSSGTALRGVNHDASSASNRNVGVVKPSRNPVCESDDRKKESVNRTDAGDLTDNLSTLPYYHGPVSSAEAKGLLRAEPSGTFLLRDSQSRDPRFPFAITVVIKTTSGRRQTQSVRVARCQRTGKYHLDCDEGQLSTMPQFSTVESLINSLIESSKSPLMAAICVQSDRHVNVKLPLLLTHPLLSSH